MEVETWVVEMVLMPKMACQMLLWDHCLADCFAVLEVHCPIYKNNIEEFMFHQNKKVLPTLPLVGGQRPGQKQTKEQPAAAACLSESSQCGPSVQGKLKSKGSEAVLVLCGICPDKVTPALQHVMVL